MLHVLQDDTQCRQAPPHALCVLLAKHRPIRMRRRRPHARSAVKASTVWKAVVLRRTVLLGRHRMGSVQCRLQHALPAILDHMQPPARRTAPCVQRARPRRALVPHRIRHVLHVLQGDTQWTAQHARPAPQVVSQPIQDLNCKELCSTSHDLSLCCAGHYSSDTGASVCHACAAGHYI